MVKFWKGRHGVKLIACGTVIVSALATLGLLPAAARAPAGAAEASVSSEPSAVYRSLAGEQWHYRAQIDGRDGLDDITITAQPGFTLSYGFGLGQVLVHVDFNGGPAFAEAWQDLSYYSVRTPWTPWLGATDLDRRGGQEILLGFSTGPHTQSFSAYSYRSNGELLTFRAPRRSESWMVNSSYGTGTSGWRCTRRGVQSRAVSASGNATARVKLITYKMGRNGQWRSTKRVVHPVHVDAQGNPPAYTAKYARFACPGLPKRVL